MSGLVERITKVQRQHTWGIFRDAAGFAHSGCMCKEMPVPRDHPAHVAERVAAELAEHMPERAFTDDVGRRWQWCGGQPGTWAWRVTGEALRFTEEKHTVSEYEHKAVSGGEGNMRYGGQMSRYLGQKTVHRWVSDWEPVLPAAEPKPAEEAQ